MGDDDNHGGGDNDDDKNECDDNFEESDGLSSPADMPDSCVTCWEDLVFCRVTTNFGISYPPFKLLFAGDDDHYKGWPRNSVGKYVELIIYRVSLISDSLNLW